MRIAEDKKHLYIDLKETKIFLGIFNNVKCYDTYHAINQFHIRHPNLFRADYNKVLKDGIEKIFRVFDSELQNYSIESSSTDIKIPLDLKRNIHNHQEIVGLTATTLHRTEHPKNTHGEQRVFVENSLEEAKKILTEKSKKDNSFYSYEFENTNLIDYFECGEHYSSYETIEVE